MILVEPVGMDCPACQAFAGGNGHSGPFGRVRPQAGMLSIEEALPQYGDGLSLDDPRLVFVQLLLYDMSRTRAPTVDEARRWAEHFGMDGRPNWIVLVGDPRMIGAASYARFARVPLVIWSYQSPQ